MFCMLEFPVFYSIFIHFGLVCFDHITNCYEEYRGNCSCNFNVWLSYLKLKLKKFNLKKLNIFLNSVCFKRLNLLYSNNCDKNVKISLSHITATYHHNWQLLAIILLTKKHGKLQIFIYLRNIHTYKYTHI